MTFNQETFFTSTTLINIIKFLKNKKLLETDGIICIIAKNPQLIINLPWVPVQEQSLYPYHSPLYHVEFYEQASHQHLQEINKPK